MENFGIKKLLNIVLYFLLNFNFCYSQSDSMEVIFQSNDSDIIKLSYNKIKNLIYVCQEKQIISLILDKNEIKYLNIPIMEEDESIENLVFDNQGIGYLLTSKNLYKTTNDLTNFKPITLPGKIDINKFIKFDFEEINYFYVMFLKNDDLILSVEINRYDKIVFIYDGMLEKWIPLEYEFVNLDNMLNKNTGYQIESVVINQTQIDSIFVFHNYFKDKTFLNKFEIPNSFEIENTITYNRSTLYFFNEKVGIYYNINNPYTYLTATREIPRSTKISSINLFSTTDGGKNWLSNSSLQYNDINFIKFFDVDDGYLICSNINKEGEYKENHENNTLYIFDDAFEPKDFDYFLMKSTDKGISWVETNFIFNSFEPCDVNIKKGSDESYWLLIKNSIFKSSDGLRWDLVNNNLPLNEGELNFMPISISEYLIYNHKQIWKLKFLKNDSTGIYQEGKNLKLNDDYSSEYQKNLLFKESFQFNEERWNAFSLYNQDSFSVAIPILKNLLNKDLYYKNEYLFKLGYSFLNIENYSEAIYYFEKAFSLDSSAIIANNLGFAYQNIGNYETALKYYEIAIEMSPDTELYKSNYDLIKKLTYKLANNEIELLQTYFPTHKAGSKMLYWQRNNSAYYYEKFYVDRLTENWNNIIIKYFYNLVSYQINEIKLSEKGEYKIIGNSLVYFGSNEMLGNYSYKLISFPLEENLEWITFGFPLKVLSIDESITTSLGKHSNCLMLGNEYYREYYAPGIGLILAVSKIESLEFQIEKELISFDLNN